MCVTSDQQQHFSPPFTLIDEKETPSPEIPLALRHIQHTSSTKAQHQLGLGGGKVLVQLELSILWLVWISQSRCEGPPTVLTHQISSAGEPRECFPGVECHLSLPPSPGGSQRPRAVSRSASRCRGHVQNEDVQCSTSCLTVTPRAQWFGGFLYSVNTERKMCQWPLCLCYSDGREVT